MSPTFIVTWVAEAGLAVRLEVTCDVGSTQHFATNVAGHFAFMPNHVGAQTVFGSKGGGTGLGQRISEYCLIFSSLSLSEHLRNLNV